MLRRKASPTETELQDQYSHMVDEALEMIAVETLPGNIPGSFIPSLQSGAQPQP